MESLSISRNGKVYKMAYFLMSKEARPEKVNLCRFFWRCVGMLLVVWPIILIVYTIFFGLVGIVVILAIIIAFLLGYKPAIGPNWYVVRNPDLKEENREEKRLFVSIKRWPNIKGHRITITHLLILWLSYGVVRLLIRDYGSMIKFSTSPTTISVVTNILKSIAALASVVAVIVIATLIMVGISRGSKKISKSEPYQLFKAFLRAKKERVCPVITVTD